jgi:hypothetical protein
MHTIASAAPGSGRVDMSTFVSGYALEEQVQGWLNLVLELKNPAQMPALMKTLEAAKEHTNRALWGLHYIHSARFLPTRDGKYLQVVTVFDGDFPSYVMDFVAVVGDIFSEILLYVKDAPPLPVVSFPREFFDWVIANNLSQFPVWVAYPDVTTIDILTARRHL